MEYHGFLREAAQRSNQLLNRKNSNSKVDAQYHFTKKFIHLTFLMTMTFDRLRQKDHFEGQEFEEITALNKEYDKIKHWKKKEFTKSNDESVLNFKQFFNLDCWFYYRLEELPPATLPILIESLKVEDDAKAKVSLDQILSVVRNAVAHGQIDFSSKSAVEGRQINYIYFCSELRKNKETVGRAILALDERALEALINSWHSFVMNSPELHNSLRLFEHS